MANGCIPENHPIKAACLNDLGISFLRRFECLGDITDLDEAITAQQQSVSPQAATLGILTISESPSEVGLGVWATLPVSTKRLRLISMLSVSPQMVTLTSLGVSITSELAFNSLGVWVTLPSSTKRSLLSSRPSVSPQMVTLISLQVSITLETPLFVDLRV
jgi:hypothetical protein